MNTKYSCFTCVYSLIYYVGYSDVSRLSEMINDFVNKHRLFCHLWFDWLTWTFSWHTTRHVNRWQEFFGEVSKREEEEGGREGRKEYWIIKLIYTLANIELCRTSLQLIFRITSGFFFIRENCNWTTKVVILFIIITLRYPHRIPLL